MKYTIPPLKPIGAKVVVQIETVPECTPGGIRLSMGEVRRRQDGITEGIVVGVGSAAFNFADEGDVPEIGDLVTFAKYSGPEIERNGNYYRVLADLDIHSKEKYVEEKDG